MRRKQGDDKMEEMMLDKMEDNVMEKKSNFTGTKNVLIGLAIGSLAGALTMLLVAPQSGQQTRLQIQDKAIQLKDQTTTGIKKAYEQVRSGTKQLKSGVQEKAVELKQRGQVKLAKGLDRVSAALESGKDALKSA